MKKLEIVEMQNVEGGSTPGSEGVCFGLGIGAAVLGFGSLFIGGGAAGLAFMFGGAIAAAQCY